MRFLLNWLFNHLLFAGTLMFAAGAPVLGEGVSDAGETGTADDTGLGDTETSVGDSTAQTGDDAALGTDKTGQEAAKPQTHRAVLESFTKSEEFKALQTAKPEVAKAITRLQQTLSTISKSVSSIGGLKEVPRLAEAISKAGGLEALSEMSGRIAEIDEIDAKLAAGDPAYITDIATNMPEEFQAMMPHALDKWAELNPEGFTHLIAQNVVGSLFSDDPDAPGIANLISRAFDLLGQNKPEDAQKLLKNVYGWCKNVRAQATAKPKAGAAKADGKITEQKAALEKKELEFFDRSTGSQVETYSLPKMQAEIKRQFGEKKVSQETIDDMAQSVTQEMTRRAAADEGFQRQVKAARAKRDEKALIKVGKEFADKNIPEAVKLIYGRRYRGLNITQQVAKKGAPVANGAKITPNAKAQVIAVKPKDSDLQLKNLSPEQSKQLREMGYNTLQQAIMNNIAFTRTGKLVQWQKDA